MREEIQAMFSLDELKNTRYFQQVAEESRQEGKLEGRLEGKLEGKLESVPGLLQLGLTVEQIARALQIDVVEVIKISNQRPNNSDN
jgi:predicted transposase/invertase (TIGR01784 family)